MSVPWRFIKSTSTEAGDEGKKIELISELFTDELMCHLLESEELLRKTPEMQELYRHIRYAQEVNEIPPEIASSYSAMSNMFISTEESKKDSVARNRAYVTEDDIQRFLLQSHGVPGIIVRIEFTTHGCDNVGDGRRKASVKVCDKAHTNEQHKQSYDLLDQYREVAMRFVQKPYIRSKAFFLRNNIQKPGYNTGDIVDKSIPFGTYASQGKPEGGDKHKVLTLGDLFQLTRDAKKKHLVILSGSIT